jgi:succinate dehydrogenase/fumarate reductase-like Fe-S protein
VFQYIEFIDVNGTRRMAYPEDILATQDHRITISPLEKGYEYKFEIVYDTGRFSEYQGEEIKFILK